MMMKETMSQVDAEPSIEPRFRRNVPLAEYTTWHIGGPADIFFEPINSHELISAWNYASEHGLHFTVIGAGSNVLVDDAGIPGLTVSTRKLFTDTRIDRNSALVEVDAGYPMSRFAVNMCKKGVNGFQFLAGIPGTIGGGIVTNAGIGGPKGQCIKDVLHSVEAFDTSHGQVLNIDASDLDLGYRKSSVSAKNLIVLRASFKITDFNDPARLTAFLHEAMHARCARQPIEPYTAGSVFIRPKQNRSAGWYIEQAGLKGYRIGGAYVSSKHANWIINDGSASSNDVKNLIDFIRRKVMQEYDIELIPEVKFLP